LARSGPFRCRDSTSSPCPLTAPCLSVLWLSVGLRGVVDVPPAAWVAMPDLDRTALPSGGDLACRIGGLRKEGRQSYVLALLQCVLRSILPSARGQEGIDALNNAMKDTDAALKPGCRAGWGRRGGLKRIPRRHTLFYFLLRSCGADHLVEPRFPLLRYYIASLLWLSVLLGGFFFPFSWLQSTTARKHVSDHQTRNDKFKTDNAVQAVHGTISFVLWQVGGVSLRAVQGRLHYHDQSH
jgi:hypothetical protein